MRVKQVLQSRLRDMRPAEAEVARRLLRDLRLVAEGSLRGIARRLNISDATVMRACRAAGFDGFQDLKYHVLREFTSGVTPRAPSSDIAYHADVTATLDAAAQYLPQAAELLRGANRVALVGVGASQGVAMVALDILFTLGRQALLVHTEQMAAYVLTAPVDGLVVLAISHSGETQFPISVVREARLMKLDCIALTNEPASELARSANALLPTQAVEAPQGSYAIAPRICQLAVLDRLFEQVMALEGGRRPASGL